jgi:osmotically-inducible protein OsmY
MCQTATDEHSRSPQEHIEPKRELAALADDVVVGNAYQVLADCNRFRGRSESFKIAHSNGVLTIAGCVPSFYLKQLLQEVLKRVDGVQHIDNQVDVVALDELSSVHNGSYPVIPSKTQ